MTTSLTISGATVEPSQRAAATAPSGDPLDIIGQALRAEVGSKAFRAHIIGNDGDTKYENTIEYVAPDHLHVTSGTHETIYVKGLGTWSKASDGTWKKSATDLSADVFKAYEPDGISALLKGVVVDQVRFLGPELKDGRATLVYQFVSSTKISDSTTLVVTNKIWIGATDGLPYRLETDNDSILHAGAKAHSVTTIDYDASITIETPSS